MQITRTCPMCGKKATMELDITMDQIRRYKNMAGLIQDIFPNLTPTEREFYKTGYCKECQDILFAPPMNYDDEDDDDDFEIEYATYCKYK